MFSANKPKTRWIRWLFAGTALTLATAMFSTLTLSAATAPAPDQPYAFMSKVTTPPSKCMDVKDWSSTNGATIQIWDCHFGDNQIWTLKSTNSGYFTIVSKFSGKCLDVKGASKDDKARVQLYQCHGKDNQQWKPESRGDGFYTFKARHSGKCLDVQGASSKNGATLQQYKCHGNNNQLWQLSQD